MTCITCKNLKSHGTAGQKMARQGFGGCEKLPAYKYMSLTKPRQCEMYQPAPADKVEQRKRWVA